MPTTKHLPPAWQHRLPWTARQPFKTGWLALNLLFLVLVRLPFWSLCYLSPGLRPNPRWTWRQTLVVRLFRFHHTFTPTAWPQFTAPPQPGSLGGEKALFDVIEPASKTVLKGVLSPNRTPVLVEARPGNWYPSLYDKDNDTGKMVILYLYGGAYVLGGHTPHFYAGTLAKLLPALDQAKFFSVGYRLASSIGNYFPAQLFDAVSAYQHLLKLGIQPARIVLMGDSAGGNLALALLRYLVDNEGLLPFPAAACLASPWVDLSFDLKRFDQHRNAKYEIITPRLLQWGVDALIPPNIRVTDPYISPGLAPFAIPVPIWIEVDENEVFVDSVIEFVQGLRAISTNDVELRVPKGGTHATLMWGTTMGFKERVDESVASIKAFLATRGLLK